MIYVASSWKNDPFLDLVHAEFAKRKLATLDFRDKGRWWEEVEVGSDPAYGRIRYEAGIETFEHDFDYMKQAKGAFVVLPAMQSVCLEAGWFAGQGKPVVVWGEPREPLDIMWLMVERAGGVIMVRRSLDDAIEMMQSLIKKKKQRHR